MKRFKYLFMALLLFSFYNVNALEVNNEVSNEDNIVVNNKDNVMDLSNLDNADETMLLNNNVVYVAEVNGVLYEDIDIAIENANDNDVVTLLSDVNPTKTFYKSLTFTGNYKITYDVYGWRYTGNLTIDGATLIINSDEFRVVANNGEASNWAAMVLNGSLTVTNSGKIEFNFDSKYGTYTGIYTDSDVTINVLNSSKFYINGKNTKGTSGQGIQLGKTADTGIFVKSHSEFKIDGTNRGYVNSPVVYVEDSDFSVVNCTNNASNGGTFTAINSNVTFTNNASLGLSTKRLNSTNSTFILSDNGYSGLVLGDVSKIDGKSKMYINNNNKTAYRYGAFWVGGQTTFESGAILEVNNNEATGIRVSTVKVGWAQLTSGSLLIEDGVSLSIMNNKAENSTIYEDNYGGGIYATGPVILPKDAKIYNNHAKNAADDIYVAQAGYIDFGNVGTNWILDDCTDLIDGWYDDSENTRWNAHGETLEDDYTVLVEPGKLEGISIKAAHGTLGKLIVKHVDTEGKELLETIETIKLVGTKYETNKETIKGYAFESVTGLENGEYIKGDITVTYVYHKTGKLIINYVDTEGNKLLDSIETEEKVGTEYKTSKKDIEGYDFVNVTGLEEGTYDVEDTIVTYVYEKQKGDLVINYVDTEGNKLIDSKKTTEEVGTKYETTAEEIDGYELKEVQGEETGTYELGTTVVTYVYEVAPNTGISVNNNSKILFASTSLLTIAVLVFRKKRFN